MVSFSFKVARDVTEIAKKNESCPNDVHVNHTIIGLEKYKKKFLCKLAKFLKLKCRIDS